MDSNQDIFYSAAKAKEKALKTSKNSLAKLMWIACSLICVAFPVLASWVSANYQNPFTAGNILSVCYAILCNCLMFVVTRRPGYEAEVRRSDVYGVALAAWQKAVDEIRRRGLFIAFGNYCNAMAVAEPEEYISHILDSVMLSRVKFDALRDMSKKDLLALVGKPDGINMSQYKAILKAKKPPQYKPIDPSMIICRTVETKQNNVGRHVITASQIMMFARPATIFATNMAISAVAFSVLPEAPGFPAVVSALSRVVAVVTASLSGYQSGIGKAKEEASSYENKAAFIERFFESLPKKSEKYNSTDAKYGILVAEEEAKNGELQTNTATSGEQ